MLYIIYTNSQQLIVEKHKTPAHTHEKTIYKASELVALLLGFTPFFIFKIVPPPTTSNTHARDTSSNCRDKEPTPGTGKFITSTWRGDYIPGWPTRSILHYYVHKNDMF